jgi:TatA/E family protein of Tat protein translocase
MFNLGPFELVAIFVVALLVFGPDKLPEIGKQVGRAVKEFRKFQESMQTNVRDVLEPISGPIQGAMQENAKQVRDALGPIIHNGPIGPISPPDIGNVNVPRSATIQSPQPPSDEDATPPGTFGHYAPVEPPAPAVPSNGPAPSADPPAAPAGGETPPASPTDPDAR